MPDQIEDRGSFELKLGGCQSDDKLFSDLPVFISIDQFQILYHGLFKTIEFT